MIYEEIFYDYDLEKSNVKRITQHLISSIHATNFQLFQRMCQKYKPFKANGDYLLILVLFASESILLTDILIKSLILSFKNGNEILSKIHIY